MGAAAPVPVLHVYTQQPWNPEDLALWGSKMPRLQEDAERCAQLFSNICTGHNPSYSDVQILLKEFFRADERERIFEKDAELT